MTRRGFYLRLAVPLLLVGRAACVLFEDDRHEEDRHDEDDPRPTISSAVKSCLSGVDPFVPCVNERAMAVIEHAETIDSLRLDPGLEISRRRGDEASVPRGVYSFGDNPYNVGAVVEAASSLLSRRTFCWDIGALYPGLQMRIGPTYNGKGVIDFIIDSRRKFDDRGLSYGHMIFKRSLLPNVLATQISIASVIPLMFAAIYFLTKKAFILSKIALIVTSVVGYGSLFLHHGGKPIGHSFAGHHHVPTFGHQPTAAADPGRLPAGGHHSAFVGDIRGDKFYGHSDGFQQISSSKPSSLFRGVNYFPQDGADAAYKDLADRSRKGTERT